MRLYDLCVEHQKAPLGIDISVPRFSWKLESPHQDTLQTSYHVKVTTLSPSMEESEVIWDSGTVVSEKSVLIPYGGTELKPRTVYQVCVKVTDNHGEQASAQTCFETGLLKPSHMDAKWITHSLPEDNSACPIFSRKFAVNGKLVRARIYATSLGIYEMALNGSRVGDAYFTPGWTNYHKRLQYQTYDVTEMLTASCDEQSCNELCFTVADGWYKGPYGVDSTPNLYGDKTAVLAEIHLEYEDGSQEVILTDDTWDVTTGSVLYSEIYMGETCDTCADSVSYGKALIYPHSKEILVAQEDPFVRPIRRLPAVKSFVTPKGEKVLDFGQNLAGFIEFHVQGEAGQRITIRHAEALDKEGNFYTENLRAARSTDVFVCDGTDQVFSPHFTYHGFRFVAVDGINEIDPSDFTAVVLSTDMEETGTFTCSDPYINRLQENIRWGERDNFVEIPTDCPQRDERMGWTGDAQVFCKTASFNLNTALFFKKWLRDLKSEQNMEFGPPHVVPNIWGDHDAAAAWSDAATIVPWTIYQVYGDERVLEEQYDSMRDYVDYITAHTNPENGLWQTGFQYADWLALDREELADRKLAEDERVGATDPYLVANAYYAYSTSLLCKAAEVLGKADDLAKYRKLYQNILDCFRKEYVSNKDSYLSETQTGCILALYFDLVKPEDRAGILASLKENIERHGNHLTTGFVGTPYICHTLSDNGLHDLAGILLMNDDFPSWLYSVKMGATTIWERWNSINPDGSFDESGMNSLNHYAYGSVGSWMYENLAGIQLLEPGYKKIRFAARPIDGIDHVEASYESAYGRIGSAWNLTKEGGFTWDITVPANSSAEIVLPGSKEPVPVGSGEYHFTCTIPSTGGAA